MPRDPRVALATGGGAAIGAAHMIHYTAAKGGVVALTRSLAVELGRHGITVNAVSPGFVLTPMAHRAIDADLFPVPYERLVSTSGAPRRNPDEAGAAIAFFASADAGYVTAQVLGVNGGCCP